MNTCLPMVHILSPEVCSPTHHHQNHIRCLGLENAGRPKPEAHLPTWNCWNYSEQPTPRPGPLVQILPVSLHCWDYSPMGRIHQWSVQKKKLRYSNLATETENQSWEEKLRHMEVSSRGFVASSTTRLLTEMGIRGQAQSKAVKALASVTGYG